MTGRQGDDDDDATCIFTKQTHIVKREGSPGDTRDTGLVYGTDSRRLPDT